MLSDNTIQKVRDLDIVDVLKSQGLRFQRRGSNLFALCPFHSERTPSFTVTPGKNVYYCQSCHKGGDAIRFVMEREGLSFSDAVVKIARDNNIAVNYINTATSEDERERSRHREELLNVVAQVQDFFVSRLRVDMTPEARAARSYVFNRWPQEFCSHAGIGYAPDDKREIIEYCNNCGISTDLLLELGILKKDQERGLIYTMFRRRITIPIKDKFGRTIAFTARTLDFENKKISKYINSTNSDIFVKSESIFGIDKASRCKDSNYFNIVEGAPDVLRMQSIGLNNTVATNGTAWSEKQFEILKRFTGAICFIPDSDVPKDLKHFGPGFEAVIKNGSKAIKTGFVVSVKELPFKKRPVYVPLFDYEIEEEQFNKLEKKKKIARKSGLSFKEVREIYLSEADLMTIPRQRLIAEIDQKNDADDFITSVDIYNNLEDVNFPVWLARKRFASAASTADERECVSEIAKLLSYIKDPLYFDECIDGVSKIYGRVKQWKDAVSRAKNEARKIEQAKEPQNERERDIELLKRFNLSIRDNCYYTFDGDDEPTRLSNFILEPLFHIEDENNGTRIFKMKNTYGQSRIIELRESELCSLSAFTQRVGSLGNFVWRAKADKLNNVKEYTYAKTDSAERIRKLGWDNANQFFAFGNGVYYDGEFLAVDEMGIVHGVNNTNLYIPATSKMYANNPEIFQFERLMIHENNSGISLNIFSEKLCRVFGDQARIAICYLIATLFRDIIYKRTRHFPILNLFGEKGTGKTTLATCLQSFFLHGIEPPNIGVTSVPAMNDRVSQAVNTLVVFDEYRNDLDVRKIQFFKGLWGGGGQTKKNSNTDGMAAQTIVSTGVALCGQDKPTQDMALFTRLIFLQYNNTSFSQEQRKNFDDLVALCNMGLTHLTLEILSYRSLFEKNFPQAYALTKSELADKLAEEEVHDRIFGNWIIPLATFRVLETVIDLPFSYSDLFDTAIKGVRNQNEFARESSEVADFWNTLQGLQSAGRCVEKAHFRIRYLRSFRSLSMKEDMIFPEAKPILYLNAPAVAAIFNGARAGATNGNRSNWSTILSYLKSHPAYLGLKQDRFVILTPQGTPDYSYENNTSGTQIRREKVNRPKAMCFDYSILKETFGLTLETETVNEYEDYNEDVMTGSSPVPATDTSLFDDES